MTRNRRLRRSCRRTLRDWTASFACRTTALGGEEITAILALAGATEVIAFSGGFPDPATFPSDVIGEIAARLIAEESAVALQYSPTEGLAGLRDYVAGRLAAHQGTRPAAGRADDHQRWDRLHGTRRQERRRRR